MARRRRGYRPEQRRNELACVSPPPATEAQSLDDLRSIPFDRFSFGGVLRNTLLYSMTGYIGMVVVVRKALTSGERLLLMQWMKHEAGL